MVFSKKWLRIHPKFLLHFLIHIDVLMLCRKFELIPTKIFRVMAIFKNRPIFGKKHGQQSMVFSKKCLQNHPQFLLHFLIHIDFLMLCRKFGLIPTKIFRVMAFFKKLTNFRKKAWTIAHGFFQKWLQNHPKFLLHFLIHIDVLMLKLW